MAVGRGAQRVRPVLTGRQDGDREGLDEPTRRLRERLLDTDAGGVDPDRSGNVPAGAGPDVRPGPGGPVRQPGAGTAAFVPQDTGVGRQALEDPRTGDVGASAVVDGRHTK
ncbi:hypothetical protein [Streptomyces griseomycini]|uniref:Uncharacterized protein n=1 Tax=Streptomyces griseomycini TaxID=66895 RepID=A0A7W7PPJ9_9ACTN|nr:hypothetical protein [Streptomyces griseomycini]MBB4898611.1 hypothetical protein [Streptomyces griseomycini]GGR19907.1 hypothetical protein GCM10015536_27050 [Streptomyces griseomycini]